jgi:Protein of unknown function (DUF3108)
VKIRLWLAFGLGSVLALMARAGVADDAVATYTANYRVEYQGKNLGTAQWSVRYLADKDVYEFTSATKVKGLLKLITPNPATERSLFRMTNGKIVPLEFWFEDGSRKGDDNFHMVFDWERNVATVSKDGARRELPTPPGTLDRGSMQVALMRDLATAGKPASYLLADDDSVNDYVYADEGEATTGTGLGQLETRSLMQTREGSSRSTHLWMAPSLRFLPARMEQHKNGEVQTAFTLDEVSGLEGAK